MAAPGFDRLGAEQRLDFPDPIMGVKSVGDTLFVWTERSCYRLNPLPRRWSLVRARLWLARRLYRLAGLVDPV